ncbi:MAG: Hsp20/alpha crystallin family protein [Candidatus Dependentiae bacterium]|jgi:HSP20 family protein
MNTKAVLLGASLLAVSATTPATAANFFDDFEQSWNQMWADLDNNVTPVIRQARNLPSQVSIGSVRLREASQNKTTGEYKIVLETPGYSIEELTVDPLGNPNRVDVFGKKENKQENKQEYTDEDGNQIIRYHYSMHSSSEQFSRSFRLPTNADLDTVKAVLKNGLLTITVNMLPEEKHDDRRSVEITEE